MGFARVARTGDWHDDAALPRELCLAFGVLRP
jgi:hypothetical protein